MKAVPQLPSLGRWPEIPVTTIRKPSPLESERIIVITYIAMSAIFLLHSLRHFEVDDSKGL